MSITESDLPGVGKKFEIELADGEMVVVIHNTGKREVFRRPDPDADSEQWYELHPGSGLIGETLESADIGNRTGLAVVAIQRDDTTIDSPPADTTLKEGDTLIGVGTREDCEAFEELLAG